MGIFLQKGFEYCESQKGVEQLSQEQSLNSLTVKIEWTHPMKVAQAFPE